MKKTFSREDWDVFCGSLESWQSDVVRTNEEFKAHLEKYLLILLERNEQINLTAIRDFEEAIWKHLLDSLSLVHFEDLGSVLDLGTGGGLPGIPLMIWRKFVTSNSDSVLFADTIGKKIKCVDDFINALELSSGECAFHAQGIEIIKKYRPKTVVMRAVAPPERAIEWFSNRVSNWIIFCGPQNQDKWINFESKFKKKGFEIENIFKYQLPKGLGERSLIKFCST